MITIIQVLVIAILIAIGFFLAKTNIFTDKTSKELSYLLINIITPALILNSFQIDYTPEKLNSLLITFGLSFLAYAIVIVFSFLYCGKDEKNKIERLIITFSNAGFMGIPLTAGIYGNEGVFYASIMVIVFNITFWSYGIAVIRGNFSSESLKQILFSPTIISVLIGIILFVLNIKLPEPLFSVSKHLANMNTPLAMLVAGISISQSNILSILKNKKLYKTILGKLIFAPIIVAVVYMFIPVSTIIKEILVLQVACPAAASIGIAIIQYNGDNKTATEYFTLTTLMSIITIPIVQLLCGYIL